MERTRIIRKTLFVVLLFGAQMLNAQNTMRIHYKDGTCGDVAVEQIDSITFVDGEEAPLMADLKGCWLWGNTEAGYYELLTFNEDHTYTGYDNYFTYGFDTMTYGWWGQMGAMLTLQSNGIGYQHRYNWFITALTENALGVMTKMGPFTYYKVQPNPIRLKVGESLSCNDDESIIFADGIIASIEDNQLRGLNKGETYILKMRDKDQMIVGYQVVVS